uniref:Gamma-interferon-inducible lysosomal thiol reductase n=1 Tax=Chromera velia CCMP2878 TaxID=1169474 RepID=A0A0G4I1B6_9ALVE|eukprot:Cvel_10083.t1-p1 / transcript=Cvel_10083.t1 / gene=Cvel_10083 / organism=Chromera_velia_CCMP2878 / gene_product=Gamma-interferon-inducible lysosomal thiol, putative / transcript_product=Gamma-interferon-inducible lysosomal thiol, putative / location=Cvel_scaffold600:46325-49401(-) / protein_length=374 / sequence_SO=supercontig / SO=protein_coding / is_pseudo=false
MLLSRRSPLFWGFFFFAATLLPVPSTCLNNDALLSHQQPLDSSFLQGGADVVTGTPGGQKKKTKVELFYETLCPYSVSFISTTLKTFWEKKQLHPFVDVQLWPYGNAVIEKGKIACQHGAAECQMNMLQACMIDVAQNRPEVFLPLIVCFEERLETAKTLEGLFATCEKETGTTREEMKTVTACASTHKGAELMQKVADRTDSLTPPHEYVPWVLVDGERSEEALDGKLVDAVCKRIAASAETDKALPDVCKESLLSAEPPAHSSLPRGNEDQNGPEVGSPHPAVCYAESWMRSVSTSPSSEETERAAGAFNQGGIEWIDLSALVPPLSSDSSSFAVATTVPDLVPTSALEEAILSGSVKRLVGEGGKTVAMKK